jgi:hypothetical protein
MHDKKRQSGSCLPTSGEKAVSNTQTKYFLVGHFWLFPGGFGDIRKFQMAERDWGLVCYHWDGGSMDPVYLSMCQLHHKHQNFNW